MDKIPAVYQLAIFEPGESIKTSKYLSILVPSWFHCLAKMVITMAVLKPSLNLEKSGKNFGKKKHRRSAPRAPSGARNDDN
jgi:hypothetical protein